MRPDASMSHATDVNSVPQPGTFLAGLGLTNRLSEQEHDLVERLRQRNEQAWVRFLNEHRDSVFRFCLRMLRTREEAEDTTQEIFLNAANALGKFRGDASLKTWLYQIAHNACLTQLSKARREARYRTELSDLTQHPSSDTVDAEQESARSQMRSILEAAIGELDFAFREAILLREVEHQSYEEIADATGVSVNTVKTRIHRARVRLRERLKEFR